MAWLRWAAVALGLFVALWFVYDGTRGLVVGDYVTPSSGPHAGQLGPWHHVVEAVGIAPRSTWMKAIFVGYGLVWSGVLLWFAWDPARGAWPAVILAAGSLWYLPFGTVLGVVQIALLLLWIRFQGPG